VNSSRVHHRQNRPTKPLLLMHSCARPPPPRAPPQSVQASVTAHRSATGIVAVPLASSSHQALRHWVHLHARLLLARRAPHRTTATGKSLLSAPLSLLLALVIMDELLPQVLQTHRIHALANNISRFGCELFRDPHSALNQRSCGFACRKKQKVELLSLCKRTR
jgi:hypothetical protein